MTKQIWSLAVIALCSAVLFSVSAAGQTAPLLKRTTTKTDRFDFGVGGTVAIAGAPTGSIHITGSPDNAVEITAEIELQAPTEADLAKLADVTTFVTDEEISRAGIITVGTHNKLGPKNVWKKFPKDLIGLPFRIDYTIKVPQYCDLEIDGGRGDLTVSGVEGAMRINFLETTAKLDIISGETIAVIQNGTVDLTIGAKGWRSRAADIKVATGSLTVHLPSNLSADIDATVLKTGKIENGLADLKPRDRKVPFTERSIIAKAGVGGVPLKFTVGDGTLTLATLVKPK